MLTVPGFCKLFELTGTDIRPVSWAPEGVSERDMQIAVESAARARPICMKCPHL